MSNEELVAEILAGSTSRMDELWEQIEGLVKQQAKRVMSALELRGSPCGIEFEDLCQTGYIALVDAVNTYKSEGMSFASWLVYYLKSAFAAATGYRTTSGQNEPLNNALSLDMPTGDETDSLTLGDYVEDPKAADEIAGTVEELWKNQLSDALREALATLPTQQADILRLRYFEEWSLEDTRRQLGISRDRVAQEERRGLRQLRTEALLQFYEFDYYGGTSLTAFRNSGRSVQERYLIQLERNSRKTLEAKRKP